MSGLMLGQFKEPESDIKLSIYEGSWFGKPASFFRITKNSAPKIKHSDTV